jgi:hypothetical protein
MRLSKIIPAALALIATCAGASATERFFTYTYEPETLPKGALEYEQWLTSAIGRNAAVGQEQYHRWEFRHELEYGVTDRLSTSLYLNYSLTNFREPETRAVPPRSRQVSHLQFDTVSLENRLMVLNPAEHRVGLTLYVEPTIGESQAEIEQKLILGQTYGDWKWALNLTHAVEWQDDFQTVEGEVEVSLGVALKISRHWRVGVEAREHNELPDYRVWENTAFYLGPVINYPAEGWWLTLTVMPQVVGANFAGNVDNNHNLELEGHERWNVRLIAGISF